jgi:hypothetical protein
MSIGVGIEQQVDSLKDLQKQQVRCQDVKRGWKGVCTLVEVKCVNVRRNTTVLQRTFIHLISTGIESHSGDDATKDVRWMTQ